MFINRKVIRKPGAPIGILNPKTLFVFKVVTVADTPQRSQKTMRDCTHNSP